MESPARSEIRRWHFTIVLLAIYIAVFLVWQSMDRFWVGASGLGVSVVLAGAVFALGRRGYFTNRWDQLFHGIVVLDLLLESVLVGPQDGFGYYWCALGFGLCISGYRFAQLRERRRPASLRGRP